MAIHSSFEIIVNVKKYIENKCQKTLLEIFEFQLVITFKLILENDKFRCQIQNQRSEHYIPVGHR